MHHAPHAGDPGGECQTLRLPPLVGAQWILCSIQASYLTHSLYLSIFGFHIFIPSNTVMAAHLVLAMI